MAIHDDFVGPAARHRPHRDPGVDRVARRGGQRQGPLARPLPDAEAAGAQPRAAVRDPRPGAHALRQHHPAGRRAAAVLVPRRRRRRAAPPRLHPLERRGDGDQGQPGRRRHRRPPGHLRQLRLALRGRLQPLLAGQGRGPGRRRHPHPGPRRPRHLRPGVPRGPPRRGPARPLPTRAHRRRPVELPAPAPHARLLGVPDGVDGPGPHLVDLPGPLQPLPARPPDRRHRRDPGVVLRGRRRDRRARDPRRHRPRRPRAARQPGVGRQLQPPAPRRPGAGQRQDHPGAGGRVPRCGVERHQGHLGLPVGRAAGQGRRRPAAGEDEHHRRRRLPALRGERRGPHPRPLLRARPPAPGHGRAPLRRGAAARSPAAATTTRSSTPPTAPRPRSGARRP